jgi:predicted amidohydrolase YtcJ
MARKVIRVNHRLARLTLLLALALTLLVLAVPAVQACPRHFPTADTVFLKGHVATYDSYKTDARDWGWSTAVAVKDGKIIYVGNDTQAQRFIGVGTTVVDLKGRMMMPGLEDGHTHLQGYIACNMNYEGGTIDYILSKIKLALERSDQAGMLNSNYVLTCSYFSGASILPAGTQLTSHDLDRLSLPVSSGDIMATGTTRPIVVTDLDGHKKWVNSQAMINAGITKDTPTPPGSTIGHYADGEPNGFFSDFSATWGLTPPSPPNSNYSGKLQSIQLYNQKGTTSIEKASGNLTDLPIWAQMADNGELTMRVNSQVSTSWVHGATDPVDIQARIDQLNAARAQYSGYTSPNSPGSLTVDTVKVFADGVVEYPAQTAAMLEPYNINIGTEENPIWVPGTSRGADPTVTDAVPGFLMLDANHWTIHVHAIGNRAVRDTLDNFQLIKKTNPRWDRRDTIVHVQFVDPSDMPRFGKLGVIPNLQLQWAENDSYTIDALQPYVSPAVYKTMYPARSLMLGGAVLAAGSDFPVDSLDPWRQIEQAVTRTGVPDVNMGIYAGALLPKQDLTLQQALRMATMGTAYQLHQDKVTGSIRVGKFADLIVLDQNLFKIPPSQIRNTQVLMTMVGGKVVWEDSGF